MTQAAETARPFCSELSRGVGEPLGATASRIDNWLLIEYGGYWPYEPLDAAVFAGSLRDHLAAQLDAAGRARLLLTKRPGGSREGPFRVIYGTTRERGSWFRRLEVAGHPDLMGLDVASSLRGEGEPVGEPLVHPLALVCTHGVRDRCCARYGQPLCRAIQRIADPEWAWQCTHVGGDRFAGNLVFLPEGLYFGRVGRREAEAVLASYLIGRIELAFYRGRSSHPFPVQAAERHVREATGLDGFHDLRLLDVRRAGPEQFRVELLAELAAVVHELDVGTEIGEPELLTCKAETPSRPRRFVVRAHRERSVAAR